MSCSSFLLLESNNAMANCQVCNESLAYDTCKVTGFLRGFHQVRCKNGHKNKFSSDSCGLHDKTTLDEVNYKIDKSPPNTKCSKKSCSEDLEISFCYVTDRGEHHVECRALHGQIFKEWYCPAEKHVRISHDGSVKVFRSVFEYHRNKSNSFASRSPSRYS